MTSLTVNFPASADIINITNSTTAVVETREPHGYFDYILVTVVIPYPNVMQEINGKTYIGIVVDDTNIALLEYYYSPGTLSNFKGVNTTNLTPFSTGPLQRCVEPQFQPLPPLPPIPPAPPVVFFVNAQQAQLVPAGELPITLRNASNVIGPNNPP